MHNASYSSQLGISKQSVAMQCSCWCYDLCKHFGLMSIDLMHEPAEIVAQADAELSVGKCTLQALHIPKLSTCSDAQGSVQRKACVCSICQKC